jgi:hypothetical protein
LCNRFGCASIFPSEDFIRGSACRRDDFCLPADRMRHSELCTTSIQEHLDRQQIAAPLKSVRCEFNAYYEANRQKLVARERVAALAGA